MIDNETVMIREIVNAFIEEPESAYDFMATKCYDMPKDLLRDIVLELIYAVETGHDLVSVGEELKENCWSYYFEEDDEGEIA